MKQLLDNEFTTVVLDDAKHMILLVWKEATQQLQTEDFKAIILELSDFIGKNKPAYYMTDDRKQNFVFSIDIQEWMAATIGKACAEAGVKKFAIIRSEDMIAELSSEQVVDESNELQLPFEAKLFASKEEAFDWFRDE